MGYAQKKGVGMNQLSKSWLWMFLAWKSILACGAVYGQSPVSTVVAVTGAVGSAEYGGQFGVWRESWRQLAEAGGARWRDLEGEKSELEKVLKEEGSVEGGVLWLVLLGHGTFDGETARFNLRGDDLEAPVLAGWLKEIRRPLVVVAGFSASGAFLKPLSAPGRVVVTATKSGSELNFARFGGFLGEALKASDADLDRDGQTSLLEGWLAATRRVGAFYEEAGRIATEHALLEDNGDGLGIRAEAYEGLELRQRPAEGREADGLRAHQICLVPSEEEKRMPTPLRARRDALELDLAALKAKKAAMIAEAYASELEVILLKLARVYQEAEHGPQP
jgi:hypothetical protein